MAHPRSLRVQLSAVGQGQTGHRKARSSPAERQLGQPTPGFPRTLSGWSTWSPNAPSVHGSKAPVAVPTSLSLISLSSFPLFRYPATTTGSRQHWRAVCVLRLCVLSGEPCVPRRRGFHPHPVGVDSPFLYPVQHRHASMTTGIGPCSGFQFGSLNPPLPLIG